MTSFLSGQRAEQVAAEYLHAQGYGIDEMNWRTRYCEIDIVAKKSSMVYFIEVKYRKNQNHSSGFDYITDKKLKQMSFAAELWVAKHDWRGDYGIGAIEVSGSKFLVTALAMDL